jgi:hypothetical protein
LFPATPRTATIAGSSLSSAMWAMVSALGFCF